MTGLILDTSTLVRAGRLPRRCLNAFWAILLFIAWRVPSVSAGVIPSVARGVTPESAVPRRIPYYQASYALVVGESQYTEGWTQLPGVGRDVQIVSEALTRHGFHVEVLHSATRRDLDQAIRRFIGDYGQIESNRLLIYYAGHGCTLKGSGARELGYLVPADAPLPGKGVGAFKESAISMLEVENYAEQIDSKHVLFLFDSCFSGTLFEAKTRSGPEGLAGAPDSILDKIAKPVREFITAGTADQTVPDSSIFARQFVIALGGAADANKDGYITGSELGAFLEDTVTNYSKRAQTPRWGKIRNPDLDKGDFVFVSPVPGIQSALAGVDFDRANRDLKAMAFLISSSSSVERKTQTHGYSSARCSLFNEALVRGLTGAAANENGEVRLSRLDDYIQESVRSKIAVDRESDASLDWVLQFERTGDDILVSTTTPRRDSTNGVAPGAKRYALIVGVEKYLDPDILSLPGVNDDCKALADALAVFAGFPDSNITVLADDQPADRQPTRSIILEKLSTIVRALPSDALLFIYFRGHAVNTVDEQFVAPSDTKVHEVMDLKKSAIKINDLKDITSRNPAHQILFLIDAGGPHPQGR